MTIKLTGFKEIEAKLLDLQQEFGTAGAKRSVLPALRKAAEPILTEVKTFTPVDTGRLKREEKITAKVATAKDKKKKYWRGVDGLIAYSSVNVGLNYVDEKGNYRPATQAIEFGNVHTPPRPFIRRALVNQAIPAIDILGKELGSTIDAWATKQRNKK